MDNRIERLYLHLKEKGLEVYTPGQKQGECKSNYVVIKYNGAVKLNSFSTSQDTYSIMCYVPKNVYSELEKYVDEVYKIMKELHPLFKSTEERTPSFYDDGVKAHMISMEFISNRKL